MRRLTSPLHAAILDIARKQTTPFMMSRVKDGLRGQGIIEPEIRIRTMLSRMVVRGMLTRTKEGRHVFYSRVQEKTPV